MKDFKIPQAKRGSIALQCEYLSLHSKLKPCTLDPHECILGHKGVVSSDGLQFTPIEQPSIEATLRNCPKLNLDKEEKIIIIDALEAIKANPDILEIMDITDEYFEQILAKLKTIFEDETERFEKEE